VLLIAMGVGVLIGRSGGSSARQAAPEVITVGGSSTTPSTTGAEETFTGDWPAGTRGFTVELEVLPQSGTSVAAVERAKTSADSKGASAVGAVRSEEFASLPAASYVIYSGVYHTRTEAQKALGGLKSKFPHAKVIQISEGASKSGESGSGGKASSGSGVGSSLDHPAPAEGPSHSSGKSFEEKSKNLPDVVSTG
jgi:hypothetical protein